ncbi:hypothetical protein EJ04DRAFT_303171 [Polyplosphaeria fusca]|uniref:Uncharacterized protein n=1 Tax=Polyplosphaeria fusca TaxID=682080 RepID=A0A9P4QX20_9PLEO|nr:hypothetical protein EJ04DRAFT_303171 [Polyplosphaeria fusca]
MRNPSTSAPRHRWARHNTCGDQAFSCLAPSKLPSRRCGQSCVRGKLGAKSFPIITVQTRRAPSRVVTCRVSDDRIGCKISLNRWLTMCCLGKQDERYEWPGPAEEMSCANPSLGCAFALSESISAMIGVILQTNWSSAEESVPLPFFPCT